VGAPWRASPRGAADGLTPRVVSPPLSQDWTTWPPADATSDATAFDAAREALGKAAAAARLAVFQTLVSPALLLIDKAVGHPDGDEVTRAVDYLYSLIPLLDFDHVSPLFMADTAALGKGERQALVALTGGEACADFGAAPQFDPEDDLSRRIPASWLEAVARAVGTGFVLRVLGRRQVLDRKAAAKLGADADLIEKNVASLLVSGSLWDPVLGVTRAALCGVPFDAHAKYAQGDPDVLGRLERLIAKKRAAD
jgi:hypothetical protein